MRLCHVVMILCASRAGGADPPAAPTTPRVLVLEPTAPPEDAITARTIGNLVTVELSRDARFDIITTADVKRLADLDSERQTVGCQGESSCLAELAGALGAQHVIYGELGKLGATYVLNLNLFDSTAARALNRVAVQGTVDELATRVAPAARELMGPLVKELLAKRAAAAAAAAAGKAPIDAAKAGDAALAALQRSGSAAAEPAVAGDAEPLPVLHVAAIGLGGAVAIAGSAFDLLSPSGKNRRIDLLDAVGPGAVAAGVALIVGAVLWWPQPEPEPA